MDSKDGSNIKQKLKYKTTNNTYHFSMMLKRVTHATKCVAVMMAVVFIYPVV